MEGCKRLTAMLLTSELLPPEVPAFVGYSPRFGAWRYLSGTRPF